jgi:hypothetical protein
MMERYLETYEIYILDISNIFKCKPSLNYISNSIIINVIQNNIFDDINILFKEIWKNLDEYTKYKYNLLKSTKITYNKYNKIIYDLKTPTPKI